MSAIKTCPFMNLRHGGCPSAIHFSRDLTIRLLSSALLDTFGELAVNSANCVDSCTALRRRRISNRSHGYLLVNLGADGSKDYHLFLSICAFRNVCLNFVRFLFPYLVLFLFSHSLWTSTRSARLIISLILVFRFSIPLLCSPAG